MAFTNLLLLKPWYLTKVIPATAIICGLYNLTRPVENTKAGNYFLVGAINGIILTACFGASPKVFCITSVLGILGFGYIESLTEEKIKEETWKYKGKIGPLCVETTVGPNGIKTKLS